MNNHSDAGLFPVDGSTKELTGFINFIELVLFKYQERIYTEADCIVCEKQLEINNSMDR